MAGLSVSQTEPTFESRGNQGQTWATIESLTFLSEIILAPGRVPSTALQGLHTLLASARPDLTGLVRAVWLATPRTSLNKAAAVFMIAVWCP